MRVISPSVLEGIAAVVGDQWIRTAPAELETYAGDATPTKRAHPGAVVLPGSRDEVAAVIRILHEHRVPFVARGAGTGLSGGAIAASDTILLALTRLNRILEIDAVNRRAIVETGAVNVRLSTEAGHSGLHYAPDPSSQTVCTIGGNIAENAGGPHCLKYGVTTNHILELEVVLPDGTVTTLGSPSGEQWGPDLVGLFVGSEGMFGVATLATVRLTPVPSAVRTLLADFEGLREAGEAVSAIIQSGIVPAAIEMMDRHCIAAVEASIYAAGYPTDAGAVLLVEVDGQHDAPLASEASEIEAILRTHGARSIRSATDEATRARLWHGRKKAFGAMGRIDRDLVVQDTVVPRSALPDVLEQVERIGREFGINISNVFHAGDGNLHPNISFNAEDPAQVDRVEAAETAIMDVCVRVGGTITGEHGVGLEKIKHMERIFDPVTLAAMCSVQQVFDPLGLANPGKVLPAYVWDDRRIGKTEKPAVADRTEANA
jgi:glycolate oxidase subunit GlcD